MEVFLSLVLLIVEQINKDEEEQQQLQQKKRNDRTTDRILNQQIAKRIFPDIEKKRLKSIMLNCIQNKK